MTKDIVKQKATGLEISPFALEDVDNSAVDFGGVSSADMAIPFLTILQDLSPQIKSGPKQIELAKAGMIFNSVTEGVWPGDGTVGVIPCALRKTYVEWRPRAAGGGFVASYDIDTVFKTAIRQENKSWVLPHGNEIIPTMLHYVIVVAPGTMPSPAIMAMNRSQARKSRKWISIMEMQTVQVESRIVRPRIYAYSYPLSTVLETKDQNTWFGWSIGHPEFVYDAAVFEVAKNFASLINKDGVVVDMANVMEKEEVQDSGVF